MSAPASRRQPPRRELPRIGWREWAGLPELQLPRVKAKIDSGARSSSLHAASIELFERDDAAWVRFVVLPKQKSDRVQRTIEQPVLETRDVRSSNGSVDRRVVIETPITMHGQTWTIELTLADRGEMGFRMLLGRQAFRDRFLLDAGRSFLGGRLHDEAGVTAGDATTDPDDETTSDEDDAD